MKKIIAILSAFIIVSTFVFFNAYASNDDIYAWVRETEETSITEISETIEEETTITTTEETTTTEITTEETVDTEKEMLKKQIEELNKQLSEQGMTIDDLTLTVDELERKLQTAYNLAQNMSDKNSSGGGGGGGSAGKPVETVTEIVTTPVVPDTDGNAELIEEAKKKDTERQFITVAAKDGSVFYVVIDYESEGENVYFLNKVDAADLQAIINPDGQPVQTEAPVTTREEPKVTEPVVTEPIVVEEKKESSLPLISAVVVIGGLFIAGYYFLKIRPNKNGVDDDDDYTDEDEYYNTKGSETSEKYEEINED